MAARSMLAGWGDAALDASIVAGVGVALDYFGISDKAANVVAGLVHNVVPTSLLQPLIFGGTIWLTVFIYDLVMLYKYDYHFGKKV